MEAALKSAIDSFPRVQLTHTPTPLEKLTRLSSALSAEFQPCEIYVKRDDCTNLAMGGNKARQLEFYLGDAVARGCDSVVSRATPQSNHLRMLAAAAAKLEMECHIQFEHLVDNDSDDYRLNGNVLLDQLFGAKLHVGASDKKDESDILAALAETLAAQGKNPYIIPLQQIKVPLGALGYVLAAIELKQQIEQLQIPVDLIVLGSGSGTTHAGVLTGLRLLGVPTAVLGVCVRCTAEQQRSRVFKHCENLAEMLGQPHAVSLDEVWLEEDSLAPGYGYASAQVKQDIRLLATHEGLLTDPVYSGKTFSSALNLIRNGGKFNGNKLQHIVVVHTGGIPGLFAHREEILSG